MFFTQSWMSSNQNFRQNISGIDGGAGHQPRQDESQPPVSNDMTDYSLESLMSSINFDSYILSEL